MLGNLPQKAKDRLLRHALRKTYRNDQLIFSQGDPGDTMLIVLTGAVRILNYDPNGKEIIFRVFGPGQVIGEFALIDERPRSAEARAIGHTDALLINRRDFLPVLRSDPDLAMSLLQTLCERLRKTNEMLEDLTFLDLGSRLAKSLIQLSRQHQNSGDCLETLSIKASQQSLASMVGSTREAVNKKLREWEQAGLISLKRGEVRLLQIESIKALYATD